MKAILVIDIDDSLIEGEERFVVDGYLMQESDCAGCYEAIGRITNAVLKPMPKKKPIYDAIGLTQEVINLPNIGYNKCIEEIEE